MRLQLMHSICIRFVDGHDVYILPAAGCGGAVIRVRVRVLRGQVE